MSNFQYDKIHEVLIKSGRRPMILHKTEGKWRPLDFNIDANYGRALFLGEGWWEYLDDISDEEAKKIANEYGADIGGSDGKSAL